MVKIKFINKTSEQRLNNLLSGGKKGEAKSKRGREIISS